MGELSPAVSVAAPATCPVALRARLRRCRLPTGSPAQRREEGQVRAVALDVHRDFCEVAIVAEGRLRSAGRIATRPEALELFGRSLDRRDRVALEVTGNAWEIARIIEPHVARDRRLAERHRDPAGPREDRSARRAGAGPTVVGGSARRRVVAGRADPGDAPPARTPVAARARAVAREERDPRGVDALPEGPPAGVGSVRRQGPPLAGRAAALPD